MPTKSYPTLQQHYKALLEQHRTTIYNKYTQKLSNNLEETKQRLLELGHIYTTTTSSKRAPG